LLSQDGEHVHSGHRLPLQQDLDVMPVNFETDGLLLCNGRCLMWRLLEHGCEAKELSLGGLINHDLLMIFVHRGYADRPGDQHVWLDGRVAHLVNALPRRKGFKFDLARQNCCLFIIEQSEQWDLPQYGWVARHEYLQN